MDATDQPEPISDATILAYKQRQLASGRVKPAKRIVRCFNQLDSALCER